MSNLLHDARYALRLLRRSPGFAMTAVMTLALAIGANTAIFSAVKGVLISPLPYPDPDRLVRLFEESLIVDSRIQRFEDSRIGDSR